MVLDFFYYKVYLKAGIDEAERYLLSNDLFWPLSAVPPIGTPAYPSFTLGSFLFYQACIRPLALDQKQRTTIQQIDTEIDAIRTRWRVAWGRKADWEYKSRLRQWGNVLKEIRIDPEDNIDYYNYEVRLRVFLQLLGTEIKEIDLSYQEHLDGLDLLLRALFQAGGFIWDSELEPGFPADIYWYLWGIPKEP
jgi:hypothetical protein